MSKGANSKQRLVGANKTIQPNKLSEDMVLK
jgi:hypothetical protein